MTWWEQALLILGMMAVTFGVRYPILALSGRLTMPAWLVRALSYVPVAVLSAIAIPMMLAPQGQLVLGWENEYLVAGIASILFAAYTRHLLWTIVLGMALFLVLRLGF